MILCAHLIHQAPEDPTPRLLSLVISFNADGRMTGNYVKVRLLPLIEYLPGEKRFPWLRSIMPNAGHLAPGPGPVIFEPHGSVKIMPLVCYESVFPEYCRRIDEVSGNLWLEFSDDSWFYDTHGLQTHLAMATFRSAEMGIPLVRVANSGISACIQSGGVLEKASLTSGMERTTRVVNVLPSRGTGAPANGKFVLALALILLTTSGYRFVSTRRGHSSRG